MRTRARANVRKRELSKNNLQSYVDRKTQLNELGITIRDTLKFADQDRATFNSQIEKINALAAELKFSNVFKAIEYPDAEVLRSFIGTVPAELRKSIGEIEKFQKDLDENEKGIKEHARLLYRKKQFEKAIKIDIAYISSDIGGMPRQGPKVEANGTVIPSEPSGRGLRMCAKTSAAASSDSNAMSRLSTFVKSENCHRTWANFEMKTGILAQASPLVSRRLDLSAGLLQKRRNQTSRRDILKGQRSHYANQVVR